MNRDPIRIRIIHLTCAQYPYTCPEQELKAAVLGTNVEQRSPGLCKGEAEG